MMRQPVTKKKILFLDDHLLMRLMAIRLIAPKIDAKVRAAPCESEPIKLVETWGPDLVVLDPYNRPGTKDGFDVLKELKENPKTSGIPIVIWTNFNEDYCEEHESYRNGAAAYISKAVVHKLISTLNQMLEELDKGA